ncbi:histidine phosphatase superfamily [Lentinula aciculospora]|uniref:Histidine phosphatase superfamily n=1 Tax=Lentinula aciculospora TaxID=153920 RepID=A0A9W9ALX7_9AGAR|nr:histidine phosphatase superfamily [Lentinula aciculospora]
MSAKRIHALRHGQAIHNVQKGWPERDPPLTEQGIVEATGVPITFFPDLIICSPMARTIQTLYAILTKLKDHPMQSSSNRDMPVAVEIWPELRETHDHATCNLGRSRAELEAAYPSLDFSQCHEEWDYPGHTDERAFQRAESLLQELRTRPENNVLIISHRGILQYTFGGEIFRNCEIRSYEFNDQGEVVSIPA